MRTVGEIVDAVQEQQPVADEELRLALLALNYALGLAVPFTDASKETELLLRMRASSNVELRFRVMRADPTTYLGPNWTPGTEENKRQRELSKRLFAAVERKRRGGDS